MSRYDILIMKKPRINFICVNFNNSMYTEKMCESLFAQIGREKHFEIAITIVDNSTDPQDANAVRQFAKKHSTISYFGTSKNLGYFGGLNYGLGRMHIPDWDYIVICNNDLSFDDSFCSRLFSKKYNSKVFAICPNIITSDGIFQNPHIKTRISKFRRLQFDLYFSHYSVARLFSLILRFVRPVKSSPVIPAEGCELHMGIGACYILTASFLSRFNNLEYPHFLYGEEAYFSNQIHSARGILWFDPDLQVEHAESASLSKIPKRMGYEFARSGYSKYRKML